MQLQSVCVVVLLCTLKLVLSLDFQAKEYNSFQRDMIAAHQVENLKEVQKRSVSLIAKGAAALKKVLVGADYRPEISSSTIRKYSKTGDWNTAERDFRSIVEPKSIRMPPTSRQRNGVVVTGTAGDRKIVLIQDGYHGHPTLQVIDDRLHLHKAHVDEIIYKP